MRIPKMVSCFGRVCAPWLIVFLSAQITSKTRVTALDRGGAVGLPARHDSGRRLQLAIGRPANAERVLER